MRAWQLAALLLAAAAAGGCERASASKRGEPLVIAKVNGTEIAAKPSTVAP